eukprot:GFYU01007597.1.p1 GENE.GFYU01007597.1~~GFYU01007597.1.p1  ORF type:complete len:572 (+),score=70.78 GFYU01007597.1:284-1999(+)
MRLTNQMLEATAAESFAGTVEAMRQLNLSNREFDNVDALGRLTSLEDLNLAFNSVTTIQPISQLSNLVVLNIIHNQLPSLSGIGALANLRYLKCSNNKIRQLGDISNCLALEELWIQNNALPNLAKVVTSLQQLPVLSRLILKPNPCCKTSNADLYKNYVIGNIRQLKMMDAAEVTERQTQMASAWISGPEGDDLVTEMIQAQSAQSLPRRKSSSDMAHPMRSGAPKHGRRSKPGANDARGGGGGGGGGGMRRINSAPSNEIKDSDTVSEAGSVRSTGSSRSTATVPRLRRHNSFGGVSRRAGMPVAPPIGTIDENTSIQSVMDSIPTFVKPRPKPKATPPKPKPKPKKEPKAEDATPLPPLETDWCLNYADGSQAVNIRIDGSAVAKWPNKNLAISVDPEGESFRFYGTYFKSGSIALSFDEKGTGYVNLPNGQTFFSHNANRGGFFVNDQGALEEWTVEPSSGCCSLEKTIEKQLDEFMSFRFKMPEQQVQVFFSCKNVHHMFVRGKNVQDETWVEDDALFKKSSLPAKKAPRVKAQPAATSDIRSAVSALDSLADMLANFGSKDAGGN